MKTSLLQNTLKASIAMIMCLFFVQAGFAQITLFSEDFDGIGGTTAGGAGTYSFPSGWTKVNVDNRTPAGSVAYVNEAWERREDFAYNVVDSAVFSTSWYSPAGAADDWMWTPPITLSGSPTLSWNAIAYDPLYPDGYEVRIMVDPTVPTGTTGSLGNMVSNSTLLTTVAAENDTWTPRSVSLAAYTGQTVRIAFRNNSNDQFLLLIDDILVEACFAPSISCAGPLNLNNDPGICTATISNAQLLAQIASSGGDPSPTITFSPAAGNFALGTTVVTATASNTCGPDATCTFNVVVTDNEDPSITCPSDITVGTDAGVCEANVTVPVPTFSDNCSGATITNDFNNTTDASGVYPDGTTTVTWTVTDAAGNTTSCSMFVTVADDENPTAACQDITVDLVPLDEMIYSIAAVNTGTGAAVTALANGPDASMGDIIVLGGTSRLINNVRVAVGTLANLGPFDLELSIYSDCSTNGAANSACGNGTGTLLTSQTLTGLVFPTAGAYYFVDFPFADFDISGETDNTISVVLNTTNTDLLWAVDCTPGVGSSTPNTTRCGSIAANNGCARNFGTTNSFYVEITATSDVYGAIVDPLDIDDGSTDNCGVIDYSVTPNTFSCAEVGANAVTLTVTDAAGNSSSCNATVTVQDVDAPVITCPGDIIIGNDPGDCGALVSYNATATDNCSATVTYDIASGSFFAVGTTTTVTATATDPSGLTDVCTFTVTVNDTEDPVIDCLTTSDCNTTASADVPVAVLDNSTSTSTLVIGATGTINDVNVLNLTASHTWTSDLTVTLTSPAGTTVELFSGSCAAEVDVDINFDDSGAGNDTWPCSPLGDGGTYQPNQPLSAFNGENPVGTWTLSVTDVATFDEGSLDSWSLEICTAGAGDITVSNDPGVCEAVITVPQPTFSDNCPGTVIVNSHNTTADASGTYQVGTTTVNWTATDASGNTSTCTMTVTVNDDEAPSITCPGDVAANNDAGVCGKVVTYAEPTVADNCELPLLLSFSDNSGIVIPDNDIVGGSGTQTVSGLAGTILGSDVFLSSVCLDVSHTWVNDLTFILESPDGSQVTLLSGVPCIGDDLDVCIVPGTGSDFSPGDCSNSPAYSGNFSAFSGDLASLGNGTDPNGSWVLYAYDGADIDSGTVNNWTLTFEDLNGEIAIVQTGGLSSGSTFPVGTTTNTFEITDGSGNTSTCSFDVTIADVEAPVFSDCSTDILQDNDPGLCGAVITYAVPEGGGTLVDQVGNNFENGLNSSAFGPFVSADDFVVQDGSCFDLEQITANIFTNTPGDLTNVDVIIFSDAGGQPGSVLNTVSLGTSDWSYTQVGANFGFDNQEFTFTLPSAVNLCGGVGGTTYWLGLQGDDTFFWEVSTTSNHGDNGAQSDDTGGPWDQSAGANFVFSLTDLGSNVFDNCDGFVYVEQTDGSGYSSGDEFPIGTTLQEYTATDLHGNVTVCSFDVTVVDAEDPIFTVCPSEIEVCEDQNPITYADPTATDNCSVVVTQIEGLPSGSDFPAGITTNTFVATDPAGNTDTCSFDVIIHPNAVVDYSFFPTCINEIVYFDTDASIDPVLGSEIASYEWEFDDGSGPNYDVNPTHVYNTAGDYEVTLTVTTNWGCVTVVTHTVTIHPTPEFTATPVDVLCNGDNTGSITVDVTVGDAPVAYSINGGPGQSSNVFDNLGAGSYLISITDANGCSASASVTVSEPDELVLAVVNTSDALCFGQASGTADVSASGGVAAYSYSIDGGASQGSGSFTGLTAGTHSAVVTDANGCTAEVAVTVGEADEIIIDASSQPVLCYGDASGSIDATATGGTGAFQYSIDGGANYQSTGLFTGLAAGSYIVTVQDDNGCSASQGVVITEPSEAVSATVEVDNVSCTGDASGSLTVSASGGTGAYQYSIDGGNAWQSGNVFADLVAGDYTVVVEDANGCETTVDVTVGEPAELLVLDAQVTSVSCNGEGDGEIDATATGGDAPYEYSFNGGITWQLSGSFTNLAPGTYTVMVRDENGCEVASIVVVTQPDVLSLSETASSPASCEGDDDGSFTVAADGGTGPYTYTAGGNSNSDGVFAGATSGAQLVTVTDASGCSASLEVVVDYTNPLPGAAFNWFASGSVVQFSNQSTNGTSYSWDFGDGTTSTDQNPVHSYAAGGTYTVTLVVTNACGTDTITWTIDTNSIGINDPDADGNVLNVYPNPNQGQFTLNYNSTGIIGQIQVNVMTVDGKLVMAEQFTVNANTFVRNYSDVELAAGIYMVQFISEHNTEVKRVTVDK